MWVRGSKFYRFWSPRDDDFVFIALAFAPIILSSTNIAKLILAPAGHMVASIFFFHPKFTIGTLLIFGSLHQHHKLFVVVVQTRHFLILGTSKVSMKLAFAGQAVVFFAGRTAVVSKSSIKGEDCAAAGSRAPTGVIHVSIYVIVEGEVFIFFFEFFGKEVSYFFGYDLALAAFLGAVEWNDFVDDFFFGVLAEAVAMEHVSASQYAEIR